MMMRVLAMLAAIVLLGASGARAGDFASQLDLAPLRMVAVQHDQTMKTLDTFARQTIWKITGHEKIDDHEPVFTFLDMTFHPEKYETRNIIKIANVPLREEFGDLQSIDKPEKERIVKEGTVSLKFLERSDVATLLQRVQSVSVMKSKAIGQVMVALGAMEEICRLDHGFIPAAFIAPAPGSTDGLWHRPLEVVGDVPEMVAFLKAEGNQDPPVIPGYEGKQKVLTDVFTETILLMRGWNDQNAGVVNESAKKLADLLEQINPAVYPSHTKRAVEVMYNRMMMLTIPGAIFYFGAFVLFLMAAQTGVGKLRKAAVCLMIVGLLVHTTGIGIRWWLVGGIFPPIKNEFESVMCSAWFGAVAGLTLEWWKPRGFFGAAASFIGMLSLVAIFTAPYVTDRQIGGEIEQVQGVLMSYWLYIHVTMVTASYSMIGMGFLLSSWWLVRYYSNRSSPESARMFLGTLDTCNLVVLQLAFWMLGAGIILGAIWADQSWGRPWGWDPKETFALITWIVYLVAVHVRVVTVDKAWWTAFFGCIGFPIMLFNWIGVNFFLVGLHSYA